MSIGRAFGVFYDDVIGPRATQTLFTAAAILTPLIPMDISRI